MSPQQLLHQPFEMHLDNSGVWVFLPLCRFLPAQGQAPVRQSEVYTLKDPDSGSSPEWQALVSKTPDCWNI